MPEPYRRTGGRVQHRQAGGRFRRTSLADFGLRVHVHERKADGSWCGGLNPTKDGEAAPTVCGHCGEPLAGEGSPRA